MTARLSMHTVPHDGTSRWIREWALATAVAAVTATTLDAVLLQLRRGYFTGGFLAQDVATSPGAIGSFLTGSLLADAGVTGALIALALLVFRRAGLRPLWAGALACALALSPLVVANFVEYQLLTYLGDAFDLQLLFELAGRNVAELWAVSSAHLARFAWVWSAVAIVAVAVAWIGVRRYRSHGDSKPRPVMPRGVFVLAPVGLLLVATFASAALRSSSDVLDNGLRRKPTGRVLGTIANELTDVDGDGYGVLRPADPALFDASIRPYAVDVPGDGIDENGLGGDLPASLPAYREPAAATGTPWRSKPDVVLIVLESFRADAVGAIVGGKSATPVIDALRSRGVSSSFAYSHNGYTVQSRRHIFSGSVADIRGDTTLIDDFNAQGYETAYFSAQDESFGGPRFGVGFERAHVAFDARQAKDQRFTAYSTAGSLALPHEVVEERVRAFLHARTRNRPLFLFVNFQDTHFPYHHGGIRPLVSDVVVRQEDISPATAPMLKAMYLNAAANVDAAVGGILDAVRRSTGRDPGVIVTADHGESLYDAGFLGHGYALNDAQTRVPLVVANLPLTIQEPFAQADLRDAIGAALEANADSNRQPQVRQSPGRRVFQYLGVIDRPAQIGSVGLGDRLVYDLRDRLASTGDGEWRKPEDLPRDQQSAVLALIHTWERIQMARQNVTATR